MPNINAESPPTLRTSISQITGYHADQDGKIDGKYTKVTQVVTDGDDLLGNEGRNWLLMSTEERHDFVEWIDDLHDATVDLEEEVPEVRARAREISWDYELGGQGVRRALEQAREEHERAEVEESETQHV